MKGFKDTTRVQYFRGGRVGEGREVEKACGGMVKKAEGGRVTDPIKNKTGTKKDPEYGDYAIAKSAKSAKPPAPKPMPLKKAKGGAVVEKGSGEVYKSKAAMKRHEAKESPAMERAEHRRGPATRGKGVPVGKSSPMIKAK